MVLGSKAIRVLAVVKLTLILLLCFGGYAAIGTILIPILGLLGGAVAYLLRPPGLSFGDHLEFGMSVTGDYLWVETVAGLLYAVLVIARAAVAEYRLLMRVRRERRANAAG